MYTKGNLYIDEHDELGDDLYILTDDDQAVEDSLALVAIVVCDNGQRELARANAERIIAAWNAYSG